MLFVRVRIQIKLPKKEMQNYRDSNRVEVYSLSDDSAEEGGSRWASKGHYRTQVTSVFLLHHP